MSDFDARVKAWAARVLGVDQSQIQSVETDSWGNCDTCEYSSAIIDVELTDGRRFHGENTFGLFLNEIVDLDLNDDGTLSKYAHGEELFELEEAPSVSLDGN